MAARWLSLLDTNAFGPIFGLGSPGQGQDEWFLDELGPCNLVGTMVNDRLRDRVLLAD